MKPPGKWATSAACRFSSALSEQGSRGKRRADWAIRPAASPAGGEGRVSTKAPMD